MIRILLSGEFGWDINSENVLPQLDSANGEDLDVHLESPGGSVFKGIRVFNDFRDYKRKYPNSQNMLTVKGLSASMSSYFMMNPAFSLVAIEDNAVFMMHNPMGGVRGDYREVGKYQEMLIGITDLLAQAYSHKTGKSKKDIKKMMDDETWFFGEEIVKNGFADEVIKTDGEKNSSEAIIQAKIKFNEIKDKIKEEIITDNDITEIAACLDIKNKKSEQTNNNTVITPATETRDKNNTEVLQMTLKEFLDQNPAAKTEYNNAIAEATKAGREQAHKEAKEVAVFATSKDYPEAVGKAAIEVMQGNKDKSYLDALVANSDMLKELMNSSNAQNETSEHGDTKGEQTPQRSTDGVIRNAMDWQEEIKAEKAKLGLEVK